MPGSLVTEPVMENIGPVVYRNIPELKPYKNNARTHSKKQVKQIAASIAQFGFVNPVLLDEEDYIIAGHGRVEAARLLDMPQVPAIKIAHLTPEQIKAYRLADNKLAELAGWDDDILKIEFQHLQEFADVLDLTVTGFEVAEIDILLGNDDKAAEADAPFDDLVNPDPVSRPGDLWLMGNHKILCGSALLAEDYARLLGGEQAQMVFTDPPYNVRVKDISGLGKHKHAEFAMASGEMDRAEFLAFLGTALGHMASHSADGSIHFVCMDWRHIEELVAAGREAYTELKNICVWAKDNGGMGSLYRSQHEFVAVFKNGTAPHVNNVQLGKHGRYRTNLWKYAGQNTFHAGRGEDLAAHPTVKPTALVADAILDCSTLAGIVLDPFGGSGTTILAAESTGRHARLIELEPVYVDVAIRRWQKMTGKDAVHAETGKTFAQTEQEAGHVE